MGKKLLLFMLAMFSTLSAMAKDYDFSEEYNGKTIYYRNVVSTSVFVTYKYSSSSDNSNSTAYTGDIVIPSTIYHYGTTYYVVGVDSDAFSDCTSLTSVTLPSSVSYIYSGAFEGCSALTSINIPSGVATIGWSAFKGCSALTSIDIPSGVTTIRHSAFEGCSALTSINIPSSVTSIESEAFKDCSALTSINIPSRVTSIEYSTFYGCSALTSIYIPSRVTSIESYALYGCSALTSIYIPSGVTSIENNAFYGCSSLKTIFNASDLTFTKGSTENGYISYYADKVYNQIGNKDDFLVMNEGENYIIVGYIGNEENITVPSTYAGKKVTAIADDCFKGNTKLKSIVIPANISTIGKNCFYNCSSLTSLEISSGVTSIGDYAFYGCSALTSLTLPSSVTSIGLYAFYGCSALTSINIPSRVTSIESNTFNGCSALASLIIKSGVTSIGEYAFQGCFALTSLTIPSSVTSIGEKAFNNCSGLTSLNIPSSVTSIGSYAFKNCSALTSLTINSGVTSIESYTFSGCSSLTSINIPSGVTSIGSYAFDDCKSLGQITLPEELTSIGDYAFYGCTKLYIVINLSNTLTVVKGSTRNGFVGYYATAILDHEISEVDTDGMYEKDGCYYSLNNGSYTLAYCENPGKKFVVPSAVDEIPVVAIGESAFYSNSDLISVHIPSSIQSIGNAAFVGCQSLKKVVFDGNTPPTGISSAFSTLSGRLTYVSNSSYDSYSSELGSIKIYSNLSSKFEVNGVDYIPIPASHTAVAFDCDYSTQSISVPSVVTYKNIDLSVSYIEGYTFYNSSITSFSLGGDVPKVSGFAFQDCSNLITFTIEEGESALDLGELPKLSIKTLSIGRETSDQFSGIPLGLSFYSSFKNLTSLTTLYILGTATSIRAGEFSGSTSLKTLGTAGSLNSIEANAFKNFTSLSDISLDGTSLEISNNAFKGCTALNNVTLEGGVSTVGTSAFSGCTGMTKLIVNNGTAELCDSAFYNCTSLASVTLPSSISTFGNYCFYNCKEIATILRISNTQPTTIGNYAFYGCKKTPSVVIGNGCTSIGEMAFNGCTSMTSVSIGNGCTSIGNSAFTWCTALANLTIGNGCTSIGSQAFKSCTALKNVTFGTNIATLGDEAFLGCKSLGTVSLKDNVTSIGSRAFQNCTQLSSITLSSALTSLGSYAFAGCTALPTIALPNGVTTINDNTFQGCTSLGSITMPTSLASIGNSAFASTSSLSSIDLPATLTEIGTYAFSGSAITSVQLPNGVTTVKRGTFANTNQLQTINLNKVTAINALAFNNSGLQALTIPAQLLAIADSTFNGCSNLKELIISSSSKKLTLGKQGANKGLFYDCGIDSLYLGRELSFNATEAYGYSPFYGNTKLKNVRMGEKAISIPERMFANCTNLDKVDLDITVTSMGSYAFSGSGVRTINIPAKMSIIPIYAFQNCSRLANMTIPENVTTLSKYAFYGSGLQTVELPSSIGLIDEFVFANTQSLQSVNIAEGITTIAPNAFKNSALPAITIPKTITKVDNGAFTGCNKLAEVTIADGPETLGLGYNASGQGLFYDCILSKLYIGRQISFSTSSLYGTSPFYALPTLTEVVIGDIPTVVGTKLFYNCTSLTSVKIGDSVSTIGDYAFSGCSALETFSVGASIVDIGQEAFSDCTSMEELRTYATIPPTCGTQALSDIDKFTCTLYVPDGSETDYAAADQWNEFFLVETFDAGVSVSYIELSQTNATMNIGETLQLTAVAYPESALLRTVNWTSSNPSVADVNAQGIVTAYAAGSVEITATAKDGSGVTANCLITVFDPNAPVPYKLTITDTTISKTAATLVPICLQNEEGIISYQFDIHLPAGLAISKNSYDAYDITKSSRCDNTFVVASSDLNGAIRVLVYSSQNHIISGNEGEVLYLPIEVSDQSAAEGSTYELSIDGIYVTVLDGFVEHAVPDAEGTLTIGASYHTGDINNDGRISAVDVSLVVSYVLGGNPTNAIREAADANADGRISAVDVSIIVSYVLSGGTINAPQSSIATIMPEAYETATLELNADGKLEIGVSGLENYTSAQFDLTLPAGVKIKSVRLTDDNASTHTLAYHENEDGSIRFLSYSPKNDNFHGENMLAVIELTSETSGFNQFTVDGMLLSEISGNEINEIGAEGASANFDTSSIPGAYADGLMINVDGNEVLIHANADGQVTIVDMLGRVRQYDVQAGENRISLVAGVYLINNKKIIIK